MLQQDRTREGESNRCREYILTGAGFERGCFFFIGVGCFIMSKEALLKDPSVGASDGEETKAAGMAAASKVGKNMETLRNTNFVIYFRIFQQHMYNCAGRQHPDHPMHGLFTGLWHDFCLNEAGKAQRDMWFERMEFVQKVERGEIKIDSSFM